MTCFLARFVKRDCLATELLQSVFMRWQIASLCSAPIEFGFRFRSAFEPVRASLVRFFKPAAALRDRQCRHAALCRPNQTSSDVGIIGMITASARHRWTYRRRNGTKRKSFNDFSRARARGWVRNRGHLNLLALWWPRPIPEGSRHAGDI